jgi:hypothetical protein
MGSTDRARNGIQEQKEKWDPGQKKGWILGQKARMGSEDRKQGWDPRKEGKDGIQGQNVRNEI